MAEKRAKKTSDRRQNDRRKETLPIGFEERRNTKRRSGNDRREKPQS